MENISYDLIDRLLGGETTPHETIRALAAISASPELEEYFVTKKRLKYVEEQDEDYSSFIPASSLAADDGMNLCDLKCETFLLNKYGVNVPEEELARESRSNYWLRGQGTPLFNMGKLLESKGYFVNRVYDATLETLIDDLKHKLDIIAVVNGDALNSPDKDILSDDFSLDSNPNHAVVVLDVKRDAGVVTIYNPSNKDEITEYGLSDFLNAWNESKYYMVTVRKKINPEEYNPQPIDVRDIYLNPELVDLVELLCENAHDDWAIDKRERLAKNGLELKYAPLDKNGKEKKARQKPVSYSHFFVPYAMLSEEDKTPDRVMVTNTIKRLKRLGYRLVNINSMYRCPDCGEVIEPSNSFCPNCGRRLTWEEFK